MTFSHDVLAFFSFCNIRTLVSLNPIMIDGTGMCGSCRMEVEGVMLLA